MAGALQKLRSGELTKLCRDIAAQDDVLARYPLTSGYGPLLAACADQLEQAQRPVDAVIDSVARKAIEAKIAALEETFDDSARALDALLGTLALARPARALVCQAARGALFPDGMQLVNTSRRNKAGTTARLQGVLGSPSEVRELLTGVHVDGEPLAAWLERLVEAGEALGIALTKLPYGDGRRARRDAIAAARGQAIRALHQLDHAATFAGWSKSERSTALGLLDRLLRHK